jgi:hypothetical protein
MNGMNLLWVLGHKIRLADTDDSYGLIEVTSLPKVPGPPPHYDKTRCLMMTTMKTPNTAERCFP